jgi:hypothetical protein
VRGTLSLDRGAESLAGSDGHHDRTSREKRTMAKKTYEWRLMETTSETVDTVDGVDIQEKTLFLRQFINGGPGAMTAKIECCLGSSIVSFDHTDESAYAVAEAARLVAQTMDVIGDLNTSDEDADLDAGLDLSELAQAKVRYEEDAARFILVAYFCDAVDIILAPGF